MMGKLIRILASCYSLLLVVAVGGYLGANVAGVVVGAIRFAVDAQGPAARPESLLGWTHAGWLTGAGVGLLGGVHYLWHASRTHDAPRRRWGRPTQRNSQPTSVLGSALLGGCGLGLLGALLGASFLMLWFSLALSPFAPHWGATVKIEKNRTTPRALAEPRSLYVHTTQNRIALYAFWGPTLLGAVAGVLTGGISAALRYHPQIPPSDFAEDADGPAA